MMPYLDIDEHLFGFFNVAALKEAGKDLAAQHNSAIPFPHSVIDDFLPPAALEACLADFPGQRDPDSRSFDRDQERLKTSFNPDYLSPQVRSLFYSFNSRPFLQFLENLTGIEGLIPDPFYIGGGFHQIEQGGHLSVHADFNHHKLMNLERRINVLIYLNKGWKDEYGGQLELWDEDMRGCVKSVVPLFNRCVVFNTTSTSFHGNPQPITHPDCTPRRSIALYYYTATWDETRKQHTTHFVPRAHTTDRIDWRIRWQELSNDLFPPLLVRNARRVKRRLRRLRR